MSVTTEFTIGSDVSCSDGTCAELRRVVVNPVARALTHLVVEAKHCQATGHFGPIDLVSASGAEIHFRCTVAQFQGLEDAEETQFLPGAREQWGYRQDQITSGRIPVSEVEVRRGKRVHAIDGPIGQVQGLVVGPHDHHVTHVLLDGGHLRGKRRVAMPIGAVSGVDDGVHLNLTRDEDVR